MSTASPEPSVYVSIIPIFALGALFLVGFILIFAFLFRGGQNISRKTGGALALTMALIVLFSGLWCVFLSPPATYTVYKDSLYRAISIDGRSGWNYAIEMVKGDTLDGSISPDSSVNPYMYTEGRCVFIVNYTFPRFCLFIYDPDGISVWSQINTTNTYFNVKASKTGAYVVKVQNPNAETISCYISLSVQGKVTVRPLEPLGQWLSLISLPIIGLGVWAAEIYPRPKKEHAPD